MGYQHMHVYNGGPRFNSTLKHFFHTYTQLKITTLNISFLTDYIGIPSDILRIKVWIVDNAINAP